MSDRVQEIEYKGKAILYADCSNLRGSEVRAVTDEVDRLVIAKGTTDQLFLCNIEGCEIDTKALTAFKEGGRRVQPYLKGAASFGLTGLKALFMNAINRFSGMNMTAHPSREAALEYLIRRANE